MKKKDPMNDAQISNLVQSVRFQIPQTVDESLHKLAAETKVRPTRRKTNPGRLGTRRRGVNNGRIN